VGNIITAQPVISGVELGLEFRPRGLWDIGATINLGSIDFGLGTTSLLNVDLVVRRRIEALSGNSQVYAIGGISYAETGEIIGLSRQNFPIGKVSSVGPFLGLKRAGELTDRLGLELSGRVGLGILGVSAPNGMGVSPSISYRAEALLLYRVRENLQALLGFNYGGTSTSYKARPYTGGTEQNFAKPGDVNEISAGGLGVSLGVGWGF